jgi:FkbM family methyltransferase
LLNIEFIREVGPFQWAFRTAIRQFYKRVLKRDQEMRLPTGEWITLPVDSHFASEAFITRANVDWGSERLLYSLLGKNQGVFLDVGANIGYYSLYIIPSVTAAYSFEPDPRVRLSLERNVRSKPNIEVIPCAVGAVHGKTQFVLAQSAEVSHVSKIGESSESQIEVKITTIDAFVALRSLKVTAIKIDVEGNDSEVIAGALAVLMQQRPLVLTEATPDAQLFMLARKVGYHVFAYVRHHKTRARSFVELVPEAPTPGVTKMLFLVPPVLVEEIVRKAETC